MFYDNVTVLYEFMPSRSDHHIPSPAFSTFKGYTTLAEYSLRALFPSFLLLPRQLLSLSLSARFFEAWINFTASRKA